MPACVSCSLNVFVSGPSAEPMPRNSTLTFLLNAGGVGEDAVVGGLRIEAAAAAAAAAEAADVGELVEVGERGAERLRAAHRQPGHRAVLAARGHAEGPFDHRDQIGQHHLGEDAAGQRTSRRRGPDRPRARRRRRRAPAGAEGLPA